MKKLKKDKKEDRLIKSIKTVICNTSLYAPVFCFKHITTNRHYNFHYYNSNKQYREKAESLESLLSRLHELSSTDWKALMTLEKKNGLETIPFGQMQFSPSSFTIGDDEKVYSFRFNKDKNRIICAKANDCRLTLHVVGFDFDFSAYNHG